MALPGDLNTVTVTGSFLDASGTALTGSVTFTPVAVLAAGSPAVPVTVTDSTGHVVIAAVGVTRLVGPIPPAVGRVPQTPPLTYPPSWPAQPLSVILAATDNADLSPQNWAYQASVVIGDAPVETFTTLLPHSPPTIDFSDLVPATLAVSLSAALPITGGVLSGTLELGGSPPLQIPAGAAAGDVLVSDADGNAAWDTLSAAGLATTTALAAETSRAEAAEALKAPLASPALTGVPTAPTASALTDSTQLATTAYADSAVAVETSRAETAEALKAPLASPALTGTPTAPTKTALTNNTDIATTAYTDSAVAVETSRAETAEALKLPLAGGTMSGAIAMGSSKITGLADGSNPQDAVAFSQLPSSASPLLVSEGGTGSSTGIDGGNA
jgi:hypothetical protein